MARTPLVLLAAAAGAIAVNAVVAAVAVHAGANPDFPPLTLPVYGLFTLAGVLGGWFGWRAVRRRSADPVATLTWLVPAAVLVSFVPDLALLALRFIPGTSSTAVIALMAMHLVVVAFAVPAYAIASAGRRPVGVTPAR